MESAWRYHQEALRLGTGDALFYYHGGLIGLARGDERTAVDHLTQALATNPGFSIRYALHAREVLTGLGGG